MNARISRRASWVLVAFLFVGCGDDDAPADSGLVDTGAADTAMPLDSGTLADTSVVDTGTPSDGGTDSGLPDSGPADSGLIDSGPADSGLIDSAPADTAMVDAGPPATDGAFRFLTYNVAGLPGIISGSDPAVNTPLISPLLNAYEIVLAQEDFTYHADLISMATHPFISTPSSAPPGRVYGDGLARLSIYSFTPVDHVQWDECNGLTGSGTDCLAGKGFTMASHELTPGYAIDIYNLHMDAGGGADDMAARADQIDQLLDYIAARPSDRTIVVAGDTNLKSRDEAAVLDLLSRGSLTDVCRTLGCGDPSLHDRVMFRNGTDILLTPTLWQEDPTFVDGDGEDLSDHTAVGVDFTWIRPPG